ncbi:MAG: carbohydrate ABC transporter permease [Spirochaetota bacterium]
MKVTKKNWWAPWLFLLLPLLMYIIWVIAPILQTFAYSFLKWDGFSPISEMKFMGFGNYIRLFQTNAFWTSLGNNLWWLLLFAIIPVPLGLFIAMLFDTKLPGNKAYKTLLYLPMTLSFVVIGQIWNWIYAPDYGALTQLLEGIGLGGLVPERGWISNPDIVTFMLIIAGVWRQLPYIMVIYLAGLKNVPPVLVEASVVDGANWWQRFRHVILPQLAPSTIVAVTVSVIESLRAFDIVYVMTRGGPSGASNTMANYMYIESFNNYRMGYGSSIAVIQFLITFIFIMVYLSRVLKQERE